MSLRIYKNIFKTVKICNFNHKVTVKKLIKTDTGKNTEIMVNVIIRNLRVQKVLEKEVG